MWQYFLSQSTIEDVNYIFQNEVISESTISDWLYQRNNEFDIAYTNAMIFSVYDTRDANTLLIQDKCKIM